MAFHEILKDKFSTLLKSLSFKIIEETKDSLIYKSDKVTIRFIYNSYEFKYSFFIKLNHFEPFPFIKLKNTKTEYENFIVENFLKIKEEPVFGIRNEVEKIELWTTQKLSYFEIFKDTLLKGDKVFYSELNDYYLKTIEEYN